MTEEGDNLKIYDTPTLGRHAHMIKLLQGHVLDLQQLLEDNDNKTITIETNHPIVYFEFTSNSKGTARGFLIEYKSLPHVPQSNVHFLLQV